METRLAGLGLVSKIFARKEARRCRDKLTQRWPTERNDRSVSLLATRSSEPLAIEGGAGNPIVK